MMILIIAMLKTSLVVIAFIAFVRVVDLAPARVSTALYVLFALFLPVTIIALQLSWASTRPFSSLLQSGLAGVLILLALLTMLPGFTMWIRLPAAGSANARVVSPFAPHIISLTRREVFIDLAIIVCLLIAYFAEIDGILLLTLFVPAIAALIANWIIHNRLRKRAQS